MKAAAILTLLLLAGCAYDKSPDDRRYELIVCAFSKCDIVQHQRADEDLAKALKDAELVAKPVDLTIPGAKNANK